LILLPGPSAFLKIPFIVSPLNIKMLKNRGTPVRLPLCAADHAVLSAKEGENNENSNKESNQFRTFTHPDFIHGEAGPYGSDYLRYGLLTARLLTYSGTYHHLFNRSGCRRRHHSWTDSRCHLRRSLWPDQRSYGINRRLCIQRSASADQSVRPVIYLPGSANP